MENLMLIETLTRLYEQGLTKLRTEIEGYSNEGDLWKSGGEIPNSAGNLALHLIGNLNHFFGATISKSGYVRDREAEFSSGGVSKAEMISQIDKAVVVINEAFAKLTAEDLATRYPIEFQNEAVSTEYVLTYLLGHFNYHLGQIDYHRRLIGAKAGSAEAA
jgi:hypothetical protein